MARDGLNIGLLHMARGVPSLQKILDISNYKKILVPKLKDQEQSWKFQVLI